MLLKESMSRQMNDRMRIQVVYKKNNIIYLYYTVTPVLSGHSKRRPKLVFKTVYRSRQVTNTYCRILQENIMHYIRHSLSFHLSSRSLFCLFLSGRLKQFYCTILRERSGSVVVCLTRDRGVAGSSLTGVSALCP